MHAVFVLLQGEQRVDVLPRNEFAWAETSRWQDGVGLEAGPHWVGDPLIPGHSAPTGPASAAGAFGAAAFMCSRPMAGDDLSVGGARLDRGPHPRIPRVQPVCS